MKVRYIMKFYTILAWHAGASIVTWFILLIISKLLGPFIPDHLEKSALMLLNILPYFIFLALSFFYISPKGFKDAEEEKFSIIKCLFSCIIAMVVNAFFIPRNITGLFTAIPYSFVWSHEPFKQAPGKWVNILLLINIPIFTIYYGIGNIQYKRRNAKNQVIDSDSFKSEST